MDTDALTFCNEKFKSVVCVPEGNGRYVAEMGFSKKRIVEKTWWEDVTIANKRGSVQITCLPARHWSIRFNPNDCCKSLWSSWMIGANEQHVYFAGDTAYGQHFKEIAQEFPSIDLALLPTGPTEEHDTNRCDHTDAIQAVQAFQDLNARVLTPMHYGVFWNKPSTIDLPVKRLNECWECKKEHGELADKELLVARCGQEYNF
jgi:L-ascorbate metabolism protein UlaG (beta-lactamase superfamily)